MKKLIIESGLRDINDLSKRYQKAKIFYHQDLDGVVTALAMKEYLKKYGFEKGDFVKVTVSKNKIKLIIDLII